MSEARRPQSLLAATLAALLAVIVCAGPIRAAELVQERLTIPAVVDGSRVELDALVMRPDDQRPHPLAVINHGSPRDVDDRTKMSPFGMSAQAQAFARRGFVAVTFMRRGYGRSQGDWAESYGSCADPDYARAGLAGAADIAAVARFMATQPYVSKSGWISVGVSAGAFATVALSAEAPSGLVAALAFAPGRGSTSADTVCAEDRLVAAFAEFGRTVAGSGAVGVGPKRSLLRAAAGRRDDKRLRPRRRRPDLRRRAGLRRGRALSLQRQGRTDLVANRRSLPGRAWPERGRRDGERPQARFDARRPRPARRAGLRHLSRTRGRTKPSPSARPTISAGRPVACRAKKPGARRSTSAPRAARRTAPSSISTTIPRAEARRERPQALTCLRLSSLERLF